MNMSVEGELGSLKRQVRVLQAALVSVILGACATGVMAARQQGTPHPIRATEITIVGTKCPVAAKVGALGMTVYGPQCAGFASYTQEGMIAGEGRGTVEAMAMPDGAQVEVSERGKRPQDPGANVAIFARSGEPAVQLGDNSGYEMDLGSTKTTLTSTGGSTTTSADTITMFGNDKKRTVIWQVPR